MRLGRGRSRARRKAGQYCRWRGNRFPGLSRVSVGQEEVEKGQGWVCGVREVICQRVELDLDCL